MKPHYPIFNYQWTKLVVLVLVAIQIHEVVVFTKIVQPSYKQKTFGERVFEASTIRCNSPKTKWRCMK